MSYRYYYVLTFTAETFPNGESLLLQWGGLGVEKVLGEQWIHFRVYFSEETKAQQTQQRLQREFSIQNSELCAIGLSAVREQGVDFAPYPLLKDLWIVSPGEKQHFPQSIRLHAGMAFGTGRHETTQIAAELLTQLSKTPTSLLDVGSGSGVLAILAAGRGVTQITAVEIDPEARQNARKNFEANGCPQIILESDLCQITEPFQVVVANMLATTLLHLKNQLIQRVKQGGYLLLSGMELHEEEEILQKFSCLTPQQRLQKNNWVGWTLLKSANQNPPLIQSGD